jgi:hypothetical protein
MATPRSRSAALLISIYLDDPSGAGWYAQLRAFDDPTTDDSRVERVTGEVEVLAQVRRWLAQVVQAPEEIRPGTS